MVIATDATPHHWAFFTQGSGFQSPVVAPGLVLCARTILTCKIFRLLHLFCIRWPFACLIRLVALHLDNSTAKAYECNQGSTASLFLSRLAWHILNLANKHGITLIPVHIPTHLIVEANYLFWDQLVPKVDPPSSHYSDCVSSMGSTRGGSIDILTYQSVSALLQLVKCSPSWGLGIECFQPSLGLPGELCISSSSFSSPGSIHVPDGMCHQSV